MKEFPEPMVSISREEYDQLRECRTLILTLWHQFALRGNWPKEFRLPKGTTWADLFKPGREQDLAFYQFTQRLDLLMGVDDSE